MKRIPHTAAVQTILHVVSSQEHIKIVDKWDGVFGLGETVFDGKAGDLIGWEYAKITAAAIRKIGYIDGVMTLTICTRKENY